jgi:hypothetical protein
MTGSPETFICAREGCEEEFVKSTHNQKYHNDECCRLATNQRIMIGYYKTRDRQRGVERWCEVCKETKLSRYNPSDICSACKTRRVADANESAVNMLRNATFVS